MKILQFQPNCHDEILSIHRKIYENLHLERFLRQACRQIESLEKDCFKIVFKEENVKDYTSAERGNMMGTAVHPDHRCRGIATYLKACDLKIQIDSGTQYIESCSANPAMIRVNQKLGYKLNGLTEIRSVKTV